MKLLRWSAPAVAALCVLAMTAGRPEGRPLRFGDDRASTEPTPFPRATPAMISRERADRAWLSTNSARSLTFGELVPVSIFSITGSA